MTLKLEQRPRTNKTRFAEREQHTIVCAHGQMAMPTNYSACIRTYTLLNFSWDKIFMVNVQPAKTAKILSYMVY